KGQPAYGARIYQFALLSIIYSKKVNVNMKRKLKLQIQMSVDGFIAGPEGNMEWMQWDWDDQLKGYVRQLTESMDCIILGRKLAEGFIPYWSGHPEEEGAENI